MKISALVKQPGRVPYHTNISNSLEALQKEVGGYIETLTLYPEQGGSPGMVVICNEDGHAMGLEYNTEILGIHFVGPIIIVGCQGCEFCDLPLEWAGMKALFPEMWEVDE